MNWKINCGLSLAFLITGPGIGEELARAQELAGALSHDPLSIDSVLSEVLKSNPSLKAARAAWEGMKQRIPQARAWEDLRAGVDIERMGTTRFDTFTDNEWMVAQEIPLSGKNRLRGRAASAEAAGAFLEVRRRELELMVRARAAYFRLANAFAQLELMQKNQALWKQIAATTRAKYEVGTQSQADVLMAETEFGKTQETLYDYERQISDAQSQLNVLMNRPPTSPLGKPSASSPAPFPARLEDLQQMALANRPDLQILQKKIEAAKTRVKLAQREWIPDPEIRVEARQFNGSSKAIQEYDTGLFIKIPWLNRSKYRAAIEEAKNAYESAEHDLAALQAETLGLVHDQLKKIETVHHHYELFRTKLIPLAEQTMNARRVSYEADKANFLELLTSQRTVQEVESLYWNHLTDYQIAVAELEAILGVKFPPPLAAPQ